MSTTSAYFWEIWASIYLLGLTVTEGEFPFLLLSSLSRFAVTRGIAR